jgi:hypothetical protein
MNQALYAHMNNKRKMKKKKIHCQVNTSHCNVILKCGMDNFKEKIYLKISGI